MSPRDRIERIESHLIKPDIPPAEADAIEQAIQEDEDVSAIVVRTGGLGSYPAMVTASSDPLRLLEVAAHEWIHNYLFFKPLGINFFDSQEMTTLNETVADMAGRELGRMTYAALTGEEVETLVPPRDLEPDGQPVKDEFDFFRFMRETRLRTDELLAEGMIEEAERYMEERRIELQDQRIYIRKINQAYFAFTGELWGERFVGQSRSLAVVGPEDAHRQRRPVRQDGGRGLFAGGIQRPDRKPPNDGAMRCPSIS